MIKLIRQYDGNTVRRRRKFDEELNWTQVDPTARQVVRKILRDNDIRITSEDTDEMLAKSGLDDEITIRRIFTTDLQGIDMFDDKPENLENAVREIKSRLKRNGYSVICSVNRDGNWQISVSK